MFKTSKKYLPLFLVLTFAFIYRMLLINWTTYPSGADIGLHESIVNSITLSGNTNFLWNNYQMGGGLSLTFPGYHIFVSYVILLTGMPDYMAHPLVAAFFSSLIVLCAYLVTRAVWRESAAFIVAFLVAISRFDIEMLLWGGYPNVITLLLIPLTFYLYLQRDRFSLAPFLATTTILVGTIFLTHSLSAVVFVSITFATVIFASIFSKKVSASKTHLLIWLLPIFLGAVLVSLFLAEVVPAYLGANAETFTGGVPAIQLALLSTRVLPLEWVIPLFASVIFFFLFSKKYKGNFFTVPALLFTFWILVPMISTQGYLVGIYIDYNRFLYFVLLPLIILIGLGIDHGSGFFAYIIDTYRTLTRQFSGSIDSTNRRVASLSAKICRNLTRKNLYCGFVIGLLLCCFAFIPICMTPQKGIEIQSFYQVMNTPLYEAVQWAKQNTPESAKFVSDALYGWWFSGFAERPTLSAVDPQYLILTREFEPAKVAKSLLDTNYLIDNGLIQVREDGGYIGRHNPMFLAKLNWTYFPYPFLHFNNSLTEIKYRVDDSVQSLYLDQLPVREMRMENDTEHATIVVKKGNTFFNYTQLTTVYKGSQFVNMSITLESVVDGISLDWLDFNVHSKGKVIQSLQNKTIGLLDEGVKAFCQLIFKEAPPSVDVVNVENPCILELEYNFQGKSEGDVQMLLGVFSVTNDPEVYKDPETIANYMNKILAENLKTYQSASFIKQSQEIDDLILDVFDYRQAVKNWDISYVACRDSERWPKFVNDPAFSLVFINDEVAIFMVNRNFNWGE